MEMIARVAVFRTFYEVSQRPGVHVLHKYVHAHLGDGVSVIGLAPAVPTLTFSTHMTP